jgi:hypothetical protein
MRMIPAILWRMDAAKKDRQIAFRIDAEAYARYERAATREKLKVAALAWRLAEWALPHVEESGSLWLTEQARVMPPKWKRAK